MESDGSTTARERGSTAGLAAREASGLEVESRWQSCSSLPCMHPWHACIYVDTTATFHWRSSPAARATWPRMALRSAGFTVTCCSGRPRLTPSDADTHACRFHNDLLQ